jgi:cellulose synthase (UDP-forming)
VTFGPDIDGAARSARRNSSVSRHAAFDDIFAGHRKPIYFLGVAAWLLGLGWFWAWWFEPRHVLSLAAYLLLTIILAWVTLLPAYFIYLFAGSRKPRSIAAQCIPGRIAMVVTKAPSEPFGVVKQTLCAMLDQVGYEYDVWLADEAPDPETLRWCAQHGVFVSTRQGVETYHRKSWPRRTRCKEGNLAYFYDHYGYQRYDFVAQFDADHVPDPTYLREIMRPFADSAVGYVSAPSICDSNASASWAARGRLQAEASMHGCLQIGYNNGWAPLCIGSHYAVRTRALKQIGGLGPELAEDHSTTLIMNANGWKGVHAVDAIAHGEGPRTFADLAIQEFQWSRSLVNILLQYSSTYVPRLPPKLKFQFLFSQLWYPLFSVFMLVMFLLPIIALIGGRNFVNVTYPDFLLHFLPVSVVLVVLAFYWRSTGTYRPYDARILGWEAAIFLLARWPWSLTGAVFAIRDTIAGSFVDFRITPKGAKINTFPPFRVLAPYLGLSFASAATALLVDDAGSARGYYLFAILNSILYLVVLGIIVVNHARENGMSLLSFGAVGAKAVALVMACTAASGVAAYERGLQGIEAAAYGQGYLTFTETRFAVAGAGQGGARTKITRFRIRLHGTG